MSLLLSLLDPTSVLVCGVLALCLLCWMSTRRPPGLPPGPGPALPLLGHLHLLPKDPRDQLWAWRRRYGDVVSLYLGSQLTVVLTSYSAIREALVTLGDSFNDRPEVCMFTKFTHTKGIVSTSGPEWKELRKVCMEIMRQMGMGKNVLADRIQEEITHYIRAIRDHQGAPADLGQLTQASISNNICSIVFGKRYSYDDPEFLEHLDTFDRNFQILGGSGILNFLPVLEHVPGDPFRGKELLSNCHRIYSFVAKHIQQHEQAAQEAQDTEDDFIHLFLRHSKGRPQSPSLDGQNLEKTVGDLFAAGTETTATTLQWCLLLFLHHPHVQDRCFKEICDVIGTDRLPAMSDKGQLPYLEAVTREVMRFGDIAPLSVLHATSRDVTFRGYVIPKGTTVITALTCAAQDPDVWGDPENFRPERFLGPDGKLTKAEELITFGIGRRVCLGESLARMELFLYLTTLIQNFRFLPPEDGQLPSLHGTLALTTTPQPYRVRAVPRQ